MRSGDPPLHLRDVGGEGDITSMLGELHGFSSQKGRSLEVVKMPQPCCFPSSQEPAVLVLVPGMDNSHTCNG